MSKTIKELREEKQRMEAEILERIVWFQEQYDCQIKSIDITAMELPSGEIKLMATKLNIQF